VGEGTKGCRLIIKPFIRFLDGDNRKIQNNDKNKRIFDGFNLNKDVNVVTGDPQCRVCKNRLDGNPILDSNKLNGSQSYFYEPTVRRKEDGKHEITSVHEEIASKPSFNAVEIPLHSIDIETIRNIMGPTTLDKVAVCEDGKPCVQIFIVTYDVTVDGNTARKKRIYISPIIDLSDDIEKVRNILGWLKVVYNFLLVFAALISIYLLIISYSRLYSCFQYFILGNIDRNVARLAWDTVYLFRHPFNTQARNQLVYQRLYID